MIAGSMLGIGIFIAPCLAAKHIPSNELFFAAWIFTGLIALAGASIYGRLGVMMPRSGGEYIFHREALGSSAAFAYGWGLISAAFAGSLAALSVALCTYQVPELLRFLLGADLKQFQEPFTLSLGDLQLLTVSWAQLGAVGLIFALTLINTYGLKISGKLQELMTYIPLFALFVLCVYLFTLEPTSAASLPARVHDWSLSGVSTAFLEIYFAYSGWNAIIYVAGEVKEPRRNIPIALIGGTLCVMTLYLFFCGASLHFLGLEGISQHYLLGNGITHGINGARLEELRALIEAAPSAALLEELSWREQLDVVLSIGMTSLITIALLASINATVIGGGRVAYMMSKDRCFWGAASKLNEKHNTPANALWILALIASLIALFVPYETIFSLISLVMVAGGSLTAVTFYLFKRDRGERLSAVEWSVLILFVSASLSVISVKCYDAWVGKSDSRLALLGLGVVCLAFIGHWAYSKRSTLRELPKKV